MFIIQIVAQLIDVILGLIIFVIIAQVIASWLVAFGVVNTRNRAVYMIVDMLDRVTAPILQPIRRFVPSVGGLDLSPLIVLLVIDYLIRPILRHYLLMAAF
jgi:YggT family protein